jgi:hypothetical protein
MAEEPKPCKGSDPIPGHIDLSKERPRLSCDNEEHELVLIYDLPYQTLLGFVQSDGHIHYRCCPKCEREVVWPWDAIQDRPKT